MHIHTLILECCPKSSHIHLKFCTVRLQTDKLPSFDVFLLHCLHSSSLSHSVSFYGTSKHVSTNCFGLNRYQGLSREKGEGRSEWVREDYGGGLGSGMWAAYEEEECSRQWVNSAGSLKTRTHAHTHTHTHTCRRINAHTFPNSSRGFHWEFRTKLSALCGSWPNR